MIVAVLLAAGLARRFGAPKLLENVNGKALVRWSAEALLGAPVDEIVAVVPPAPADVALRAALDGIPVRFVVNADPAAGMGASLARGIDALDDGTHAALVALADEPPPDRRALLAVVDRYRQGRAGIVVPVFHGVRGHPVLFDHSVFAELRSLTGDRGAREVTDRDPARLAIVEVHADKPIDVDTQSDLSRLRSASHFMGSPHQKLP